MISNTKLTLRRLAQWMMLVALVVSLSACGGGGGAEEGGGSNLVGWKDGLATVSASSGTATLIISDQCWPGTTWQAEIVEGGEWISFSNSSPQLTKQGEVTQKMASRVIYLYYKANKEAEGRTAMIRFSFSGELPLTLTLSQRAGSGGGNNDDNGGNGGGDEPGGGSDTPSASYTWPELPTLVTHADYACVTHYTPVRDESLGGIKVTKRNYTLCYDRTKRAALWVAYPLHSDYMGSENRTEAWEYDPKIDKSWQPYIYNAYNNGGTWHRGHQLPSADRTATKEMNAQTFYFSNMTPQNGTLNSGKWATLEAKVRGWACKDTLYVVTGAYWKNTSSSTTDKAGNVCPTPTHYFKVLARTRRGDSRTKGDQLSDYKADDLQTIGFWVEHKGNSAVGEVSSWACKVSDIEAETGIVFFPTLPAEVKKQKNTAQWGL